MSCFKFQMFSFAIRFLITIQIKCPARWIRPKLGSLDMSPVMSKARRFLEKAARSPFILCGQQRCEHSAILATAQRVSYQHWLVCNSVCLSFSNCKGKMAIKSSIDVQYF